MEATHPANEDERLHQLHRFGILDTPAELSFVDNAPGGHVVACPDSAA